MLVREKGASLLEVLIASAIALSGITSFVSLQTAFMRTDASMLYQHNAELLAQQKYNDLRQYGQLIGADSYHRIQTNKGGDLASGEVKVKITNSAIQVFNRTWDVKDYFAVDTDDDGTPDTWLERGAAMAFGPLPTVAHLKQASIQIRWIDNQGKAQVLVNNYLIAPIIFSRRVANIQKN